MRVFFGTLGLTLVFATAAAAGMPDAARGRGLAIEACSACHQVSGPLSRTCPTLKQVYETECGLQAL